jgi:hypothetical protein
LIGGIFTGLLWGSIVGLEIIGFSASGLLDSQEASMMAIRAKSPALLGSDEFTLWVDIG